MTPVPRRRWGRPLSLLLWLTVWTFVPGHVLVWVCLGLLALSTGLAAYHLWRPWAGPRSIRHPPWYQTQPPKVRKNRV